VISEESSEESGHNRGRLLAKVGVHSAIALESSDFALYGLERTAELCYGLGANLSVEVVCGGQSRPRQQEGSATTKCNMYASAAAADI
jgi:hypothetical protein